MIDQLANRRRAIVRFACECASLASWFTGRCDERLIDVAEAVDRGDFATAEKAAIAACDECAVNAADAAEDAAAYAYAAYAACDERAAAYAAVVVAYVADAAADAYAAADAVAVTRAQIARRARELLLHDAPDAAALRLAVADHLEAHPDLHDQGWWGDGSADPACGTACCVAGRACHLGGGSRGLPVELAGAALLALDGAPLPDFGSTASRDGILAALRTVPS